MFRALVISFFLHLVVVLTPFLPEVSALRSATTSGGALHMTLRTRSGVDGAGRAPIPLKAQSALSITQEGGARVHPAKQVRSLAVPLSDRVPAQQAIGDPAVEVVGIASTVPAEAERQYRLDLAREARQFKRYPQSLEEGVVVVAISLPVSVREPEVTLRRSSGSAELDQLALEMIAQATKRAAMPADMAGKRFRIDLPVEFRRSD